MGSRADTASQPAGAPGGAPRAYVVSQSSPRASDDGPGTEQQPFKTISKAASLAGPGDTVLVHAGVYRERVAPTRGGELGRPVVYQAAEGESVAVRGSEVFKGDWRALDGKAGLFTAAIDPKLFAGINPFATVVRASRGGGTLGQVYLDGAQMFEVKSQADLEAKPGSWLAARGGGSITLHVPDEGKSPGDYVVEISVRQRVFAPVKRGLGYVHVRGFVFEHACNHVAVPQQGMVSTRNGRHWLIENCTVRFARGIGLECGQEWGVPKMVPEEADKDDPTAARWTPGFGYHVIRNNVISDNAQCGIAGLMSPETRIIGNVVERNAQIVPGFESGGIKMHMFWDGLIEGNLVRDNGAYGIWLDNAWVGARVTRNVIVNNKFNGVFVELGEDREGGVTIDHNIIAFNRGDGFYAHDASDVWLVNNLLLDNESCGAYLHLATARTSHARWFDQRTANACSRQHLLNNIFVGNAIAEISLPTPGGRSEDCLSDANVFVPPQGREITFKVNQNNGLKVAAEALSDDARKAFESSGDPALAESVVEMTKGGVMVKLPQWRVLLKDDTGSRAGNIGCELDRDKLVLTMDVAELPDVQARPVSAADRDFLNNLVSRTKPAVGPMEGLAKGARTCKLWPVKLDTPADVQARAAANPGDAELQLACARYFLSMAPVQGSPQGVTGMAALGLECLARVKNAPQLAARAAATGYRLGVLAGKGDQAMAALAQSVKAMGEPAARRQTARYLAEAVANDAAACVLDALTASDTTGDEAAWAVRLAMEMLRNESDPAAVARIVQKAQAWLAAARAAKSAPDDQARLLQTEAQFVKLGGDPYGQAALKAGAILAQAGAKAQSPDLKAQLLYESGRMFFDANKLDEAKVPLGEAAQIAGGGRSAKSAADLLQKINRTRPPQPPTRPAP